MRISSILKLVGALGIALTSVTSQAQSIKADIPTGLSGTYELTYAFAGTNSPHKNGDKITFVINGADDTLCVAGTLLSSPFLRTAGAGEVLWNKSGTNTYYATSLQSNGQFNEINVYQGANNTWVGQFQGSRSSTSTACAGASTTTTTTTTTATPTVSTDVQTIFDLAAQVMAQFKNGGPLGLYQGYTYKYYADSKIYVGVKDNLIYLMGGSYGTVPTSVGTVSSVLGALQTAKAKVDAAAAAAAANANTTPNTGSTGAISLYTLNLSGTYKMSGIVSISVPLNLTIPNMPAPAVSDTTVIVDQVKTSLGASGISNVKVTSINNTASRVTFRVEFSATLTGVGNVTYDLTYDYTK